MKRHLLRAATVALATLCVGSLMATAAPAGAQETSAAANVPSAPVCEVTITSDKATITWSSVEGARIYAVKAGGVWLARTNDTSFTHTRGQNDAADYYVRSINDAGRSGYNRCTVSGTVVELPSPVCGVDHPNASGNRPVISFGQVAGAEYYIVRANGLALPRIGHDGRIDTVYVTDPTAPERGQVAYSVSAASSTAASAWQDCGVATYPYFGALDETPPTPETPVAPAPIVATCSVDWPNASGNAPVFTFGVTDGTEPQEWEVRADGVIVDRFADNPEAWVDWRYHNAPANGIVHIEVRGYVDGQPTEWGSCGNIEYNDQAPEAPAPIVPVCDVDTPNASGWTPVFTFGVTEGTEPQEWEVRADGVIVDRFTDNPEACVDWRYHNAPANGTVRIDVRGYVDGQATEWGSCGDVVYVEMDDLTPVCTVDRPNATGNQPVFDFWLEGTEVDTWEVRVDGVIVDELRFNPFSSFDWSYRDAPENGTVHIEVRAYSWRDMSPSQWGDCGMITYGSDVAPPALVPTCLVDRFEAQNNVPLFDFSLENEVVELWEVRIDGNATETISNNGWGTYDWLYRDAPASGDVHIEVRGYVNGQPTEWADCGIVAYGEPPAPPVTPEPPASLVPTCSVDALAATGNSPAFEFGEPNGETILEWEVLINGQIVERFQNNPKRGLTGVGEMLPSKVRSSSRSAAIPLTRPPSGRAAAW